MAIIKQYHSGISNGYFIVDEAVIAVDTGSESDEDKMRQIFRKAGIKPQAIKLIIITHGHVDHFSNLPAMKALTQAPILCHKEAAAYLAEGRLPDVVGRTATGKALIEMRKKGGFPISSAPRITPDITIDAETDLRPWGVNGYAVPTPGHSKGCISIVLDGGEALIGDLFAQPPNGNMPEVAYFTYPGANEDEAVLSMKGLLDRPIHTFYSGHGGPFPRELVEQIVELR